jgi:peptide/nickel transport system substrate-binding protein
VVLICCAPQPDHGAYNRSGGIFRMTQTSHIETVDPIYILFSADWQLASMIYQGLVGYEENSLELTPLLAESWEVLDEGRSFRFHIRQDVYFQNNPCFENGSRLLTARDIAYTFERLAQHSQKCPNWYLLDGKIVGLDDYIDGRTTGISGIKIIDDFTIDFFLTKPYATFLKILASPITYILPPEAVEFYGENIAFHPVGTGPFRLARWTPYEKIELVKHSRYWKKQDGYALPYLDGVEINFCDDASLAFSSFLKNESDMFRAGEHFSKSLSESMLDSSKYKTYSVPIGLTVRFIGFSLDNSSAWAQYKQLRQAISLAVHRDQLVTRNSAFRSFPAHTLVPKRFFSHTTLSHTAYDTALAKSILHEQKILPPLTLCTNVEATDVINLKAALESFDIPLNFDLTQSNFFPHILEKRPDMFRIAFLPSFPDPEEYYQLFHSTTPADVNLTGYANPEYDRLLEQSMTELDAQKREHLFMQLEDILRRDVPAIFASHSRPQSYVVPQTVCGLKFNFIMPDLSAVYLEPMHETAN